MGTLLLHRTKKEHDARKRACSNLLKRHVTAVVNDSTRYESDIHWRILCYLTILAICGIPLLVEWLAK